MDTQLQKFKRLPSIRLLTRNNSSTLSRRNSTITTRNSSINARGSNDFDDESIIAYTSLKDIIVDSPTNSSAIYDGSSEFDSSNITIRNRLVRHAASSYIQSATIISIASRNQNFFANVWERLRSNGESGSGSGWNNVRAIRCCFQAIYQCVVDMVTAVLGRLVPIR